MDIRIPNYKLYFDAKPTDYELTRLVYYYPNYNWKHRSGLLKDYFFSENSLEVITRNKMVNKNINPDVLGGQSISGHQRLVNTKIEWTLIRLMYLRYRLHEKLGKEEAYNNLWKEFPPAKEKPNSDYGQSRIRKIAISHVLNKELNELH